MGQQDRLCGSTGQAVWVNRTGCVTQQNRLCGSTGQAIKERMCGSTGQAVWVNRTGCVGQQDRLSRTGDVAGGRSGDGLWRRHAACRLALRPKIHRYTGYKQMGFVKPGSVKFAMGHLLHGESAPRNNALQMRVPPWIQGLVRQDLSTLL